uniref:Uncharacterized protein n=1 Tax=Macrostomum lignano TaxID=282301 RepID=A0A1I8FI34_9PLAT
MIVERISNLGVGNCCAPLGRYGDLTRLADRGLNQTKLMETPRTFAAESGGQDPGILGRRDSTVGGEPRPWGAGRRLTRAFCLGQGVCK